MYFITRCVLYMGTYCTYISPTHIGANTSKSPPPPHVPGLNFFFFFVQCFSSHDSALHVVPRVQQPLSPPLILYARYLGYDTGSVVLRAGSPSARWAENRPGRSHFTTLSPTHCTTPYSRVIYGCSSLLS